MPENVIEQTSVGLAHARPDYVRASSFLVTECDTMTDSSEFTSSLAIHGFYACRHSWTPHIGQQLQTESRVINRARYVCMHTYIAHCAYYERKPTHDKSLKRARIF